VILSQSPQLCQNGGISFLSPIGETEKSTVGWGRQFSVKNSLVKKKSVRQCVVVMQQLVLLSPKFGAKFSHIFTVTTKRCEIDCLACQDEFFMNNPLDVKGNGEKCS
jgi:hypothetical protein